MRLSDLQNKDVVDVATGKRIGNVIDAEIEEETGLKELILEYFVQNTFHVYHEKRNGKDEKILKSTYWFKMKYIGNDTPKPQIEEGITEVSWKSYDDILHHVYPNTFQNIKLILQEEIIKKVER